MSARAVAAYRVLLGLATLAAVVGQLESSRDSPLFEPANFFSYFTVQSNLLGAAAFLAGAAFLLTRGALPRWLELARGGPVIYLAVTGVVFALLLEDTATQNAFQVYWADRIMHLVFPVAVVLDWLLAPPRVRIDRVHAALWLVYPLAWLVYTMIRGGIVDWYPYEFLDPGRDGTLAVLAYCVGIAVFFALVAELTRAAGNRLVHTRRARDEEARLQPEPDPKETP